jgi:hypothetical protein
VDSVSCGWAVVFDCFVVAAVAGCCCCYCAGSCPAAVLLGLLLLLLRYIIIAWLFSVEGVGSISTSQMGHPRLILLLRGCSGHERSVLGVNKLVLLPLVDVQVDYVACIIVLERTCSLRASK